MRLMFCFRLLVIGVVCVLGSVRSWAQLDGTGLTGTVTDATGHVIPEVQVMAVQDATGLRRETVSSGQGTYEIAELPVGVYAVSFVREGFETLRFGDVGLEVNPGGCEALSQEQLEALVVGKRVQGHIVVHIRAVKPIYL